MTFAQFWKLYPRKTGKDYARRCWDKQIKTPRDSEQVERVLVVYINCEWAGRKLTMIPHASTFLNRGYWKDEEMEAQQDDKEPMPLFTRAETEANLHDRAELIHRSLTREQEIWRREAAGHAHSERCGCGERCKYRKEPRVPTMDELVAHLKGNR